MTKPIRTPENWFSSNKPETIADFEHKILGSINDSSPVIHDFTMKTYPTTFTSIFNCVINFSIAIPTLCFHMPIAITLCMFYNLFPFSTSIRRRFQRNVKVYVEHIVNTVLGLWVKETFYVSIDSRLSELVHKLQMDGEFPKILTIGNHISELDWLFMSILAEVLNFFRYTYIIMKAELANMPILGFFAKSFGHTFVIRERSSNPLKKNNDVVTISSFANNLTGNLEESRKTQSPFLSWIQEMISLLFVKLGFISVNPGANGLYFPEATTFTESTYKSTLNFYEKSKSLPDIFRPNYVILPRPLGTAALISKLSDFLHCICDTTLLTLPFVSSTYDCLSFADIFLCKAPAFSFCMILDYLEIPEDLKQDIKDLPNTNNCFEHPQCLNDEEKKIKQKISSFLFKIFKKKDAVIKKYVEGENKGNFKNIKEFENFVNSTFITNTGQYRQCIPIKIDSPYKSLIFFAPALCFSILFCVFVCKTTFLSSTIISQKNIGTHILQ